MSHFFKGVTKQDRSTSIIASKSQKNRLQICQLNLSKDRKKSSENRQKNPQSYRQTYPKSPA